MRELANKLPFTLPLGEKEIFLEVSAIPEGYYLSIDSPYVSEVLSLVEKGLLENISDPEGEDDILSVKRSSFGFVYSLAIRALDRSEAAEAEFNEALEILSSLYTPDL